MFAQNLARIAAKISQRVVLADGSGGLGRSREGEEECNDTSHVTSAMNASSLLFVLLRKSVQPARGGATATRVVAMRSPPRARPIQYSAG